MMFLKSDVYIVCQGIVDDKWWTLRDSKYNIKKLLYPTKHHFQVLYPLKIIIKIFTLIYVVENHCKAPKIGLLNSYVMT